MEVGLHSTANCTAHMYVQAVSRSEAGARTGGKLMQDGSKLVLTTGQNLEREKKARRGGKVEPR